MEITNIGIMQRFKEQNETELVEKVLKQNCKFKMKGTSQRTPTKSSVKIAQDLLHSLRSWHGHLLISATLLVPFTHTHTDTKAIMSFVLKFFCSFNKYLSGCFVLICSRDWTQSDKHDTQHPSRTFYYKQLKVWHNYRMLRQVEIY